FEKCAEATADPGSRNPITGIAGCCACAASGHPATPLLRSAMNSRRLIGLSPGQGSQTKYIRSYSGSGPCIAAKAGPSCPLWVNRDRGDPGARRSVSALPPKADKERTSRDVGFVKKADMRSAGGSFLFDHLVSTRHSPNGEVSVRSLGGDAPRTRR